MTKPTTGTPAQPGPQAVEPGTVSLFARLGGEPAVAAVVDLFYDRVLADPALRHYFDGQDMNRIKGHQRRFIGQALGAATPYPGRSMRKAHEHLAVTGDAFDRVVQHLAAALAAAGVDEPTIGTIAEILLPLRGEVVTA